MAHVARISPCSGYAIEATTSWNAEHLDTIHFVEVKTRHKGGWQSAYDSINEQKIRTLRRGAMAYRAIHHLRHNLQFDLIAITVDGDSYEIDYVENII